jgi:hypothetical protein
LNFVRETARISPPPAVNSVYRRDPVCLAFRIGEQAIERHIYVRFQDNDPPGPQVLHPPFPLSGLRRTDDEPPLAKHGLDFVEFEAGFDFATAIVIPAKRGRSMMIGRLGGALLVAVILDAGQRGDVSCQPSPGEQEGAEVI